MMYFWISILTVGALTLAMRSGFIVFNSKKQFPKIVDEFLDYVPVCAMIAIASAHIIYSRSENELVFNPEQILAGIVTLIIAYISKNLFFTLACGMGSIWVIQYFL